MLSRALEVSSLSAEEIETVSLDVSEHENAFAKGEVDAVVTFEPVRSRLLNSGGKIIFESSQIPDEIVDVLVVRRKYLRQHQGKVSQVIAAWFRALAFMESNRAESIGILAPMDKLSEEEYLKSLGGLRFPGFVDNQILLNENIQKKGGHSLIQSIAKLENVMLEKHLLNKDIDTSSMISYQSLSMVSP